MTIEYKLDPEDEECQCCGFRPVPTYVFQCDGSRGGNPIGSRMPTRLCEVCSTSMISNSYNYPNQYPDSTTLQALGFVANTILARIDRLATPDLKETP